MNDRRESPYKRPSDEEVRRAKKMMLEDARGLDEVSNAFLRRFRSICRLNHFEIMPQIDVDFRAYIFFDTNDDLAHCQANGTVDDMQAFVREQLVHIDNSRSNRVDFELDSFENVRMNFEGSYFLRLRS